MVFVRHGVLAIGSTEVVGWDRLVQGLLPAHHLLTPIVSTSEPRFAYFYCMCMGLMWVS